MNEKTEKIKKIRNLLLAGGCIITAIICRHLPANRESGWLAFFQLTRAYLYITLYCVWGISLQRRIVNRTARRCLCGIASLMVFWFVIRTLKYNVFYEPVLRRYSWYGYYVPLLAIPSLSVIAALKMRESENQKRRQWTGIFLVITVGVILIVDYFTGKSKYEGEEAAHSPVNWAAIIGVVAGAVVGNLTGGNIIPGFTFGIAAINNMIVAVACYLVGKAIRKK